MNQYRATTPDTGRTQASMGSDNQHAPADGLHEDERRTGMQTEQYQATQETRRAGLRALRAALLQSHKEVIQYDRGQYERLRGPIPAGQFVQIVTEDDHFRWLDPLSRLIVEIDEELDGGEHHDDTCRAVAGAAEKLFGPSGDPAFRQRYHEALQDEPAVTVAHGQLMSVIVQLRKLS
ncbi:hypothetical protein CURE108131_01560 [Cupriavidus respiraculi]|uniref:Uncharacterized protein n=2 Tax=Cupriavidus respiraculi TaxID=195930 RepID=A0ABM8WEK2_9BURK|nr:hypothetical protein LMG21510_00184 [Cupriavidus respiraculi]